jgi:hypothetical protein
MAPWMTVEALAAQQPPCLFSAAFSREHQPFLIEENPIMHG